MKNRRSRKTRQLLALLSALFLLGGLLVVAGCQPAECRQMRACCQAIEAHEGVGEACGELAQGVDSAETCQVVVDAARAMFEQRDEPVPAACE